MEINHYGVLQQRDEEKGLSKIIEPSKKNDLLTQQGI
jgi:hypothetical protein